MKRPIRAPRGSDGRFLPVLPNPPGSPLGRCGKPPLGVQAMVMGPKYIQVPPPRRSPPRSHEPRIPSHLDINDWVQFHRAHPLLPPKVVVRTPHCHARTSQDAARGLELRSQGLGKWALLTFVYLSSTWRCFAAETPIREQDSAGSQIARYLGFRISPHYRPRRFLLLGIIIIIAYRVLTTSFVAEICVRRMTSGGSPKTPQRYHPCSSTSRLFSMVH